MIDFIEGFKIASGLKLSSFLEDISLVGGGVLALGLVILGLSSLIIRGNNLKHSLNRETNITLIVLFFIMVTTFNRDTGLLSIKPDPIQSLGYGLGYIFLMSLCMPIPYFLMKLFMLRILVGQAKRR